MSDEAEVLLGTPGCYWAHPVLSKLTREQLGWLPA